MRTIKASCPASSSQGKAVCHETGECVHRHETPQIAILIFSFSLRV